MLLSVLDQTPVLGGLDRPRGAAATRSTSRALADRLGYHRYWLAEHHGLSLAGPSPEVLIGPVAAATERIRVGSGGVMLPHYSPFKVAENFSLLAGLYPGRIDLAHRPRVRHRPADHVRAPARPPRGGARRLPAAARRAARALRRQFPADHPFARLGRSLPGGEERPEIWLLGSSAQSAVWAAQLGLPYAFADFINPRGAEIVAGYRQRAAEPRDRDRRVGDLRRDRRRGRAAGVVDRDGVRDAAPEPADPGAAAGAGAALPRAARRPGAGGRRRIVGSPETVRAGIEAVAAEYGADEVILVTITHDHAARRRSYELIAEAFGLSALTARAA